MVRSIRNTPILIGEDADRFLHEISILPSDEERRKERAHVEANEQQLVSMVARMKEKQTFLNMEH